MAFRLTLIPLFLTLAMALVVESSMPVLLSFGRNNHWGTLTRFGHGASKPCNGLIEECVGEEEEMMMESETGRRFLVQWRRFISYGALKKNKVPCTRRGHSYYNCIRTGKANPYRRGCSVITHCARQLD